VSDLQQGLRARTHLDALLCAIDAVCGLEAVFRFEVFPDGRHLLVEVKADESPR
jgi:hypothetical protein